MLENVWIIPALPALGFVLTLAFGKRLKGNAHLIGLPIVAVAFVLSLVTAGQWLAREDAPDEVSALEDVSDTCSTTPERVRNGEIGHGAGEHSEDAPTGEGTDHEATATALPEGEYAAGASSGLSSASEEEEGFTRPVVRCVNWFQSGDIQINVGTQADGQSILMLVVVTLISLLVHYFSTEYVRGDRRYTHYFAFLSLFTASMLFFVLASNTLELIVGWELVGVCSFALIGHWWEDKNNSDAALKAFLTNRVGDVGLMVGMITLYFGAGQTFNIMDITTKANNGEISHNLLLVSACCLLLAVMSKSGQFILHTWLPDAMAGPTPVSALIHAATMVVAGIYMVARLYPVFYHGLSIPGSSFNVLALVGAVTSVFGALLAFVQKDIKKVLAYSTISQLGFMVTALGVGAWTAALFHLFTHAFFKACLFLGAGSLSHACHHSFNMVDDMGGLRKKMPVTFWTFIVATAALMGIPPLAGFWSKDEILAGTGSLNDGVGNYHFALVMLLIGAAGTAAYMTRAIWYAFFGEYRGHEEPHEAGIQITGPLVILGGLATLVGFLNMPWGPLAHKFEDFVEPAGVYFPGHDAAFTHAGFNTGLAILATCVGLGAAGLVYLFYWTRSLDSLHNLSERNKLARAGKTLLQNNYYLDKIYTDGIAGFTKGGLAKATYWFNQNVIDGFVDGVGKSAATAGRFVYNRIDQGVVDGAVDGIAAVSNATGAELSRSQTGRVQQYGALFFGAAALIAGAIVVAIGG